MYVLAGKYRLDERDITVVDVGTVDETWDVPESIPDGTKMVVYLYGDGSCEAMELRRFLGVARKVQ